SPALDRSSPRASPWSTLFPYTTLFRSHIGDSLVAGNGVPKSENFVAALNRAQPGVRHVNLGASGASPEAYLLALSRWTTTAPARSEEHTSELQSRGHLVCRPLREKRKK